MSKLYIDITKDRLYVEKKDSKTRRRAQTAMYRILHALTRLVAPILCFTADEIWQCLPFAPGDDKTNVCFNDMPAYDASLENAEIADRWDRLFEIRDDAMRAIEAARDSKTVGKSLDAKLVISGSDERFRHLQAMHGELKAAFIVSQVELAEDGSKGLEIEVGLADGQKCERCWTYSKTLEEGACPRCMEILKNNGDIVN